MTQTVKPGPALECDDCGIVPVNEEEVEDDCPSCEEFAPLIADVTECTQGKDCRDGSHHYGINMHVTTRET